MDNTRRARRGLAVYFAVVVAGSAVWETMLLRTGENIGKHVGLVYLLMWTPAFASLVARLALREGIRDVSFRMRISTGTRPMLTAWLYPMVVGGLAYGFAWMTGLATFSAPGSIGFNVSGPGAHFFLRLVQCLTVFTVFGALSAAGEEIGWRGYMLTRLIDAGIPHPVLVSGLIWALWHTPLILSGQYASGPHPWASAGLFWVDVVAAAYLAARVRLESGSVWPAVMFHAAWNSVIQGCFDASTKGYSLWVGESGILVAVAGVLVVVLLVRNPWRVKHSPDELDVGMLDPLAV